MRAARWLFTLMVCWCALGTAAASAATFVWSGGAAGESWSEGLNWTGHSAPAGNVGAIEFPVGNCVFPGEKPCNAKNDIAGLSATSLIINGPYSISRDVIAEGPGAALTLGPGGIGAYTGFAAVNIPLTLSGMQTWSLEGEVYTSSVTSSSSLQLDLAKRASLVPDGAIETGPLTVIGGNPAETGQRASANGTLWVGDFDPVDDRVADINGEDKQPVDVTNAVVGATPTASVPAQIGPLTVVGGEVLLLPPGSGNVLTVNGALSLDAGSVLHLYFDSARGGEHSTRIATVGAMALGGSQLVLSGSCEAFATGHTYTLVSGIGTITGTFGGVANGDVVPVEGCDGAQAQIEYTAHLVTATIQSQGLPPKITKISPKKGPAAGGTSVTIVGTGFTGATAVEFGSVLASTFDVESPTLIVAQAPAGTTGAVDVRVERKGTTSATSTKDFYKYGNPTIAGLTPGHGPVAGGTTIHVEGSGFAIGAGSTNFLFRKALSTSVSCQSTTECTVTSPAAAKPASVDVVAEVGKAKSKKERPADQFSYE